MDHQKHQEYLEQWEPDFKSRSQIYRKGPLEERSCNDICCIVIFFTFLGATIGVGAYSIFEGLVESPTYPDNFPISFEGAWKQLRKFCIIGVSSLCLSFLLSMSIVCLTQRFPKVMVYVIVTIVALLFLGLAVFCFATDNVPSGVIILVVLGIYFLLLFGCFRQYIKTAILLVKVTSNFLKECPAVFVLSTIVSFVALIFVLFWTASFAGNFKMTTYEEISDSTVTILNIVYLLSYFYFLFYLHYTIVFISASCVSLWYYRPAKFEGSSKPIYTGFEWLSKAHIGSLGFASMMITVIKAMQMIADSAQAKNENCCTQCCVCMVQCCLSVLQGFVRTMNYLAIITMACTGDTFVESAKAAGVVVFSNTGVFTVVGVIDNFFFISGMILSVGTSIILSVLVVTSAQLKNSRQPMIVLMLFCSLTVAQINLVAFTSSMTAIFTYFCFDKKLKSYGLKIHRVPTFVGQMYREAFLNHNTTNPFIAEDQLDVPTMMTASHEITNEDNLTNAKFGNLSRENNTARSGFMIFDSQSQRNNKVGNAEEVVKHPEHQSAKQKKKFGSEYWDQTSIRRLDREPGL